jgi:hypothetical protein
LPTNTNERRNSVASMSENESDQPLNVSVGLTINLHGLGERSGDQNPEGEFSFDGLSPRSFGKKIKMSDANKPYVVCLFVCFVLLSFLQL